MNTNAKIVVPGLFLVTLLSSALLMTVTDRQHATTVKTVVEPVNIDDSLKTLVETR